MREKEKENRPLKVVIVGNGKVGFSLAEQLVQEKYDVTIVDMREESLRREAIPAAAAHFFTISRARSDGAASSCF